MIQFSHVSKTYSNQYQALNDISFHIRSGEMALLTGPSGSGKSTIFKLLLRLTSPSLGSIYVNKRNIAQLKKSDLTHLRRYIGMVSQSPQLLPRESVYDNVALPLIVAGYRMQYIKIRVNAALKKVGLDVKSHLNTKDLSGGEQKLTEIARAIVTTPKILLVDEPTANVDANTAREMLTLFKAFNQIGITIIIATHQRNLLNGHQTSSLMIKNGSLYNGELHEVENTLA